MIAILGGGISGLTAAYHLKQQGKPFILLEASPQLGGKIQTTQKEGYVLEHGPNTVLINNKEIKELIEELGLSEELIFADPIASKNRFVLKENIIEAIPNSFPTALTSNLFRFSTLKAILQEPFKKKFTEHKEESLAAFCKRRFGQQIFEDFITPFVTGIYAGDPEQMSINYTLNILKEAEQKHGSVLKGMVKIMKERKVKNAPLNLPKQKSFSFQKGLHHLILALQKEIQSEVHLNANVSSIETIGKQYKITYLQNKELKTLKVDQIIAAIPASVLAKLITPISPVLSTQLNKIEYVPALAVHLGFPAEQMSFDKKAFGILSRKAEKVPFLGILFNSHFFPHTAPQGKELLSIICGGARYPEIVTKTEEEIIQEVSDSVKKLLGITGEFDFQTVVKWHKGIPQYNLGYGEIEQAIDHFLQQHPNFYISANFYKGISVSDCIKNATILAKNIH